MNNQYSNSKGIKELSQQEINQVSGGGNIVGDSITWGGGLGALGGAIGGGTLTSMGLGAAFGAGAGAAFGIGYAIGDALGNLCVDSMDPSLRQFLGI